MTKLWVVLWMASTVSCAGSGGDGAFHARVAGGCQTERECVALVNDAKMRQVRCHGNCPAELADSERANALLNDVRGRTADESKLAAKAETDQRREEQKVQERARTEKREVSRENAANYDRRQGWLVSTRERCRDQWVDAECSVAPDFITDDEKALCKADCADTIQEAKGRAYMAAMQRCVESFVETHGWRKAVCQFQTPAASPDALTEKSKTCADDCASMGRQRLSGH